MRAFDANVHLQFHVLAVASEDYRFAQVNRLPPYLSSHIVFKVFPPLPIRHTSCLLLPPQSVRRQDDVHACCQCSNVAENCFAAYFS